MAGRSEKPVTVVADIVVKNKLRDIPVMVVVVFINMPVVVRILVLSVPMIEQLVPGTPVKITLRTLVMM